MRAGFLNFWPHRRSAWIRTSALVLAGLVSTAPLQEPAASPSAPSQEPAGEPAAVQALDQDRAERIGRLEKYLTGARLTGHFTVTGREADVPREESYWIESARATGQGDQWEITARIKYGRHDVTVPMVMEIKWAGDTPVITVDRMTIPLMGTFDARVLIRGGQYAGTWRHDDVGGHLFGRIATAAEQAEEKSGGEGDGRVKAPGDRDLPCKDEDG